MNLKNFLLASLMIATMMSCTQKTPSQAPAPAVPVTATDSADASPVIARINGEAITEEDVRKVNGVKLTQAELGLYDARKEGIDQIIEDKLLETEAVKQKTNKADLLKKEVHEKIKIDDKEIEKFYNEKKSQMQGKKIDEMKGNIRGFLFRDKYQKLYGELIGSLKKKSEVEVLIVAPKMEVPEGDSPVLGPKNAPVTIVEFTDYQCPFCGRARPTVNQILETYKSKVRYILRDFPLSFHKDSIKAHESARCAGDQGKYWEMNKKLFSNQTEIKIDDLKKYAGELKLNMTKFNTCLESGKYTATVQQSQQDGEKLGVSGTPAFFINGRMISGARPFESFKEIIDDELSRKP